MRPHRCMVIHDVLAADMLNGTYHAGWYRPDIRIAAFFSGGKWYRSNPKEPAVIGPLKNKEVALGY